MQLINQNIKNLIAGISQQPPNLRHAAQLEEQVNALSSETGGLLKRPPTLHVKRLRTAPTDGVKPLIHFINRDDTEKYTVIFTGKGVDIYDLQGNQINVYGDTASLEYVVTDDPRAHLRCVTIADYTFITNNTKITAMSTHKGVDYFASQGALVNVKSGQYGRTYTITVNGKQVASHQTPDGSDKSHTKLIDTNYIANQLASQLRSNGFSTEQGESWIHILGTVTSLETKDGYNNQAMIGIRNSIQKFTNLPASAPDGYCVKVFGESSSKADDYYVQYSKADNVWKECVCPGMCNDIDAYTMPHTLVRKADGTFELKVAAWASRASGDEDSNPDPSFIGQAVNDVFFYRNRLGFVSGENVILTRSADFFNFWVASATEIQDTDTIDLAVSDNKIALLHHAVPFGDDCLLFSNEAQFALKADNTTMSPKSAYTALLTNYTSASKIRPVAAGRNVYFGAERAQYTSIQEYATASDNTQEKEAQDITSHVPNFIPNGVYHLISSNTEHILLALTTGEESKIYVYKYLFMEGQRQQASWSEWDLKAPIAGAAFIGSMLYLVVLRDDVYYLEKMSFTYNTIDYDIEPYRVFIDRKVITEEVPEEAYDEENNLTTVNLANCYNTEDLLPDNAEYAIITPDGVFHRIAEGVVEVALTGDYRGKQLIVGQIYNYHIVFSEIMIKNQDDSGSTESTREGRLQLRYVHLQYFNSGYFKVTVQHKDKLTYTYEMTGRNLNLTNNKIGELLDESGIFTFPVQCNSKQCVISVNSDVPTAVALVGMSWEGSYFRRSRRI